MVEGGGGHAMISKIIGINTAGAILVLLTSREEKVGGISEVGQRYSDPYRVGSRGSHPSWKAYQLPNLF